MEIGLEHHEKKIFTEPRILVQIVSGNPLRIYAGYVEKNYTTRNQFLILLQKSNDINIKYLLAILI